MNKFKAIVVSFGLAGMMAFSASVMYVTPAYAAESLKQNFKDADISTVIEAVAKITGHNFVIDPRVKGKVTLIAPEPMEPSALYETLLTILNVHGYTAIPSDNVIKIVPANLARDQLPYRVRGEGNEAWVSEVIGVKNVSASKLVAVLRPLVAKEGHLVALAESNKLIVTDTVANIQRIKKVLARVDVDTQSGYEIIELKHASAEEVAKTLRNVLPKGMGSTGAKVTFDERSNRVILVGDEAKRMMLRTMVAELDVQVPTQGRVQVIYLHYAKAKDLVPVLQNLSTNRSLLLSDDGSPLELNMPVVAEGGAEAAPAAGAATSATASMDKKNLQERISIEADERMNALVISAPPAMVSALKEVVKQLDIRRAQVLIEAIFVELTETKAAELGVEWGAYGPNGGGLINFSGTIPALLSGDPTTQLSAIGHGVTSGLGEVDSSGYGWGALIRALNSDTNANILATPSLVTLDNEEAEIVVGKEVPFQTGSYTSTTTSVSNPFNTIERKDVGLKLKVKPQINEGDEIYLDIDQEISDVIPKAEAVDVQTSKRQIKTRVIVGDGNVIVLGGLIQERENEVVSKVPGLGDLPVVGALFRSKQNEREKVNLMIFLRPVIIRDRATSDYYSHKKYSQIQQQQDHLLNKYDSELLNGLRPRLPSIDQWKKQEPATPFQSKSGGKTELEANDKQSSDSDALLERDL
ncbi:type II secretion system secretin GspD [Thiomicrorhabdus sp.]|uniref:type II secretion system secretin GspD n=1 Tax=Thiomicrorhabdus sp. TaxID=2039724 RepID=UPI003562D830